MEFWRSYLSGTIGTDDLRMVQADATATPSSLASFQDVGRRIRQAVWRMEVHNGVHRQSCSTDTDTDADIYRHSCGLKAE